MTSFKEQTTNNYYRMMEEIRSRIHPGMTQEELAEIHELKEKCRAIKFTQNRELMDAGAEFYERIEKLSKRTDDFGSKLNGHVISYLPDSITKRVLSETISRSSERSKNEVIKYYQEGHTVEETAKRFKVSKSTINSFIKGLDTSNDVKNRRKELFLNNTIKNKRVQSFDQNFDFEETPYSVTPITPKQNRKPISVRTLIQKSSDIPSVYVNEHIKKKPSFSPTNGEYTLSCINYAHSKGKYIGELKKYLPKNIGTFVDLFAGSCIVGLNVDSKRVVFNDNKMPLMTMFETFKSMSKEDIISKVEDVIKEYNLSNSSVPSNKYDDLKEYNRAGYSKLRDDVNNDPKNGIKLYVLLVYSFNNQYRTTKAGILNPSIGDRDYTASIKQRLIDFIDVIKNMNCVFNSTHYEDYNIDSLGMNDFVFLDPPSDFSQNEQANLVSFVNRMKTRGTNFGMLCKYDIPELSSYKNKVCNLNYYTNA